MLWCKHAPNLKGVTSIYFCAHAVSWVQMIVRSWLPCAASMSRLVEGHLPEAVHVENTASSLQEQGEGMGGLSMTLEKP